MRSHALRWAAVLGLALAALSCSWFTDFVVLNQTSGPVTVRYVLKEPLDGHDLRLVWPPQLAPVGRFADSDAWRAVDAPASPGRQVSVDLPPGTGLRFAELLSYSRPSLDDWEDFPVERLEIESPGGVLCYSGPMILLAFEGGRHLQALEFGGTPRQIRSGNC